MNFWRKLILRSGCPWAINNKVNSSDRGAYCRFLEPICWLKLNRDAQAKVFTNGLTCPPTATCWPMGWPITYFTDRAGSFWLPLHLGRQPGLVASSYLLLAMCLLFLMFISSSHWYKVMESRAQSLNHVAHHTFVGPLHFCIEV